MQGRTSMVSHTGMPGAERGESCLNPTSRTPCTGERPSCPAHI